MNELDIFYEILFPICGIVILLTIISVNWDKIKKIKTKSSSRYYFKGWKLKKRIKYQKFPQHEFKYTKDSSDINKKRESKIIEYK